MLVYSVASMQSFEMVQVIYDKILNHLVSLLLQLLSSILTKERVRNGFLLL